MTGGGDQENKTCLFPVTAVNITGGPDGAVNRMILNSHSHS